MCTFCHEHSESVHTMFSLGTLLLPGPRWYRKGSSSKLLLASRRSDEARRRKTAGNIADGLRCCIWRRAEKPEKMTHHLTWGGTHNMGYIALLHPSVLASRQPQYLAEHRLLSFLFLACYLHNSHSCRDCTITSSQYHCGCRCGPNGLPNRLDGQLWRAKVSVGWEGRQNRLVPNAAGAPTKGPPTFPWVV